MRTPRHDLRLVLGRAFPDARHHGNRFIANKFERTDHLELLHVFRQVAAGHAFMNVLKPGKRVEFLDARLDIVPGNTLPRRDRREIDLIYHGLVCFDGFHWDVHP